MNWQKFIEIVLSCIAGAGGIGVVVVYIVKYSADIIDKRISQKFEARLQKELETFKTQLAKKEYVTKTRFDTEFMIYKQLCTASFDHFKAIFDMIPYGLIIAPADEAERKKLQELNYQKAKKTYKEALYLLYQNEPFISEEFFDGFNELLHYGVQQIDVFENRFNLGYIVAHKEDKIVITPEDRKRTEEMEHVLHKMNKRIRDYLYSLEVIE